MTEPQTSLLRALKRERLHVEPRSLEASPPAVRRRYAHAWAPADDLLARLAPWPAGLLAFWLAAPAGHVVFSAAPSAYHPEGLPWHGATLPAVAVIAVADLAGAPAHALTTLAHLLDHLLGCRGDPAGPWLADGAGATPALAALGRRLHALAALGYGPSAPRGYFAWAWAQYWLDRRALNVADPQAERLLRTTLASAGFWAAAGEAACL